jgi:hypothetical protein
MPLRGELSAAAARPDRSASALRTLWCRCRGLASNQDLQVVVIFSLIGFLSMADIIIRFPEFGGLIASLNMAP